jgi:hypothetical protein
MWPVRCEIKKVVAIARQQDTIMLVRELEHRIIGAILWKGCSKKYDFMSQLCEQIA